MSTPAPCERRHDVRRASPTSPAGTEPEVRNSARAAATCGVGTVWRTRPLSATTGRGGGGGVDALTSSVARTAGVAQGSIRALIYFASTPSLRTIVWPVMKSEAEEAR